MGRTGGCRWPHRWVPVTYKRVGWLGSCLAQELPDALPCSGNGQHRFVQAVGGIDDHGSFVSASYPGQRGPAAACVEATDMRIGILKELKMRNRDRVRKGRPVLLPRGDAGSFPSLPQPSSSHCLAIRGDGVVQLVTHRTKGGSELEFFLTTHLMRFTLRRRFLGRSLRGRQSWVVSKAVLLHSPIECGEICAEFSGRHPVPPLMSSGLLCRMGLGMVMGEKEHQ